MIGGGDRVLPGVFSVELLDQSNLDLQSGRCPTDMQLHSNSSATDHPRRRPSFALISARRRVFVASAFAAIGGVLFGYDTGIDTGYDRSSHVQH